MAPTKPAAIGFPRLHFRCTDSTNERARELAASGALHGTLVTAAEQSAGRGRQGREWSAPAGQALLASLLLREMPPLLPLLAGVAVADVVGDDAQLKWPNDVLDDAGRKLCGILVEGRPQDGWAVLGIGLNVAVELEHLPDEIRGRAGTLGLEPSAIEPLLSELLQALEHRLAAPSAEVLQAFRARDVLRGRDVSWSGGSGVADGIDDDGHLVVALAGGTQITLAAGEVHLTE